MKNLFIYIDRFENWITKSIFMVWSTELNNINIYVMKSSRKLQNNVPLFHYILKLIAAFNKFICIIHMINRLQEKTLDLYYFKGKT